MSQGQGRHEAGISHRALLDAGRPGAGRFAPQLRAPLVADEGLQGHSEYLNGRLALGQFDAMDALLESLAVGQREYLLHQLLSGLKSSDAPSPALLTWVRKQAAKAPQWLVKGEVDGFLVQLPAYDFAAEARLVLNHWQQLAWQDNYRQLLEQNRFDYKQLYYSRNPELARQQQALLTVLDEQSTRCCGARPTGSPPSTSSCLTTSCCCTSSNGPAIPRST